jgi:hypothetical protein
LKCRSGDQLRLPLLVWIDDRPENNYLEVEQATIKGIQVIELPSTAAAKAWVEENEGENRFMIFYHNGPRLHNE